ncbi:MAG: hypothetical protein H0W88_11830 [Parachlamydiaceae bacterium]|nr:hypothetical protein [Parachlamydiaceae bacterium]
MQPSIVPTPQNTSDPAPQQTSVTTPVPTSTNQQIAGAAAKSASKTPTSSTVIKSIGALAKEAPELYKGILEGIASMICSQQNDHQKRLAKIIKDADRQAQGH